MGLAVRKDLVEPYWTQPETYVPGHFDASRYTKENVSFWASHFVRLAEIAPHQRVLDIGCGTGGFTIAIAQRTGGWTVGHDVSPALIAYARRKNGSHQVQWILGDAEHLEFGDGCFDRLIMSLVIHQVPNRKRALQEAYRVLKGSGVLILRTIAPEEVARRVPFRFFPRIAELESARMPSISELSRVIRSVGFRLIQMKTIERNLPLRLCKVAGSLRRRERPSFQLLTEQDIESGIHRMREEWQACGQNWVDPRPTVFMVARKASETKT
ncbi:MAG TPA: methyltransferase domain-containing protein [Candidatus Hydrogenedentes bacterium]|nr:methyltransferase domain-containing protein [Candidatus Hydrogenedentota bacterium]HIJ74712.1 methyltransferase domain-containing protein [Candidatus Hydrogenedentota bacterium]